MAFLQGQRKELRYVQEASQGVNPGTDMTAVPHSIGGDTLDFRADTAQSDNVRADMLPSGVYRQTTSITGGHSADAMYGALEQPIRGVLNRTAWGAAKSVTGADIAAASAGNKLTSITVDKFNTFAVGDVVKVSGFVATANNQFARVTSVVTGASPELGLDPDDVTLTTEAAGASVTVMNSGATSPGTDDVSFTVERAYQSAYFEVFFGVMMGTWAFRMDHPGRVRFEFSDYMGLTTDGAATTFGTGTVTAAPSNRIFRTVDCPIHLAIDGTLVDLSAEILRSFMFTCRSPVVALDGAGSVGPSAGIKDKHQIAGSFRLYNSNSAFIRGLIDQLHDDGVADILLVISDRMASPNAYGIHLPELRLSSGTPRDGVAIETEFSFVADTPATQGFPFSFTKFGTYS